MTQDLKVKLPREMKIQSLSTQLQLGELSEHRGRAPGFEANYPQWSNCVITRADALGPKNKFSSKLIL